MSFAYFLLSPILRSSESSELSLKLPKFEMFLIKICTWSWLLAEVFLFLLSTDLERYKFVDSELINCTFFHVRTGCQISFDDDYSAYWIYFVNFLGTLAVLPGNIVSALLMDRIGRLTMLGRGFTLKQGTPPDNVLLVQRDAKQSFCRYFIYVALKCCFKKIPV